MECIHPHRLLSNNPNLRLELGSNPQVILKQTDDIFSRVTPMGQIKWRKLLGVRTISQSKFHIWLCSI